MWKIKEIEKLTSSKANSNFILICLSQYTIKKKTQSK